MSIELLVLLALALPVDSMDDPAPALARVAGLVEPVSAAVDDDGTLYVVERAADRVSIFAPGGEPLAVWGGTGEEPGRLRRPAAIARGEDGVFAVADAGNCRIQLVGADGSLLAVWGSRGRAVGEFCEPQGVVLHGAEVFVADTGNDRIQVFDREGQFLRAWAGRGAVMLRRPTAMAIVADGTVFVLERDTRRVIEFDRNGVPGRTWGTTGSLPATLVRPSGIAGAGGFLHVADEGGHVVRIYDESGALVRLWDGADVDRTADSGPVRAPGAVALSPNGALVALCEPREGRCRVVARPVAVDEEEDLAFGPAPRTTGGPAAASWSVAASEQWLAVTDRELRVVRLHGAADAAAGPIAVAGGPGERRGRFGNPHDVALDDAAGLLWVADGDLGRLSAFRMERAGAAVPAPEPGELRLARTVELARLDLSDHATPMWPLSADAVSATRGELFVLDRRNALVFALDRDLRVLSVFGEYGHGPGQLRAPTDLVVDAPRNRVYVADEDLGLVLAFGLDGTYRFALGAPEGADRFQPTAVAVDVDGRVFATDATAARVLVFAPDGSALTAWGERGTGVGELMYPTGVAALTGGAVLVVDAGNRRSVVFSPEGELHAMD